MLIRAGHTEASVDLARLAGLYPAAVICEVMNDDGTMARMPDLVAFAQRHGLKIGAIEDLIAYRLKNDHLVRAGRQDAASPRLPPARSICTSTRRRSSRASTWRSSRATCRAPGPVLVRVHAVNALGDLLGIGEAGEGSRQIEQLAARDRARKGAASSC